ncbi:hypothetical protein TNCV_1484571 [Trichonephila clavipes]|nr:hypothetical protein TNCV_1484571 [Trichonephila clavipes]
MLLEQVWPSPGVVYSRSKTSVNAESERLDVSASKKKIEKSFRLPKMLVAKALRPSVSATCKYCGSGHTPQHTLKYRQDG